MTARLSAEVLWDVSLEVGESPSWDAQAELYTVVDITRRRLYTVDPAGTELDRHELPAHVGAAVRSSGGLGWVVVLQDRIALLTREGSVHTVVHVERNGSRIRFNDAKCDPSGRLVAGTMAYDESPGAGDLYRLEPDGSLTVLLRNTTLSNGLGWSPDGKILYFVDSPTRSISAYEYTALGQTRATDPLTSFPVDVRGGIPDGLCVDDAGCIWVAVFGDGEVHRYTPSGALDTVVSVPASQPTCCTFGGNDGRQLVISTATYRLSPDELVQQPKAGALFVVDPGVSGPPATPWSPVSTREGQT